MKKPDHILVFRFSALGDVAMTVPVIKLLLQQHPQLHITYVSTAFVAPLFAGIDRLHFQVADIKGTHKGLKGLRHLYKSLAKEYKIDAVADLHDVLRTKILRSFFYFSGTPVASIDKGRKEKRELIRIKGKKFRPLKTTFHRYAQVFEKLGLPVQLLSTKPGDIAYADALQQLKQAGKKCIGIAPFAKHAEKMYPLPKMKEVVQMLAAEKDCELFLFGSKEEAPALQQWTNGLTNVRSLAGTMSFQDELKWIAGLDVMISMDSANMHLASLFGVSVVSVWGATHPYAGFYGWGQSPQNAVHVDLYCRPCSVFGNRRCPRGDHACMQSINPVSIYDRVMQQLYREK